MLPFQSSFHSRSRRDDSSKKDSFQARRKIGILLFDAVSRLCVCVCVELSLSEAEIVCGSFLALLVLFCFTLPYIL